jgi:branched-chain amino acid aminotransferase
VAKKPAEKIWKNGQLIDWEDARIHIMSHVVNYGSALFEGIRCYDTAQGPAIFRLDKHIERLFNSSKIYRIDVPFSRTEIENACIELVRVNRFRASYVRPLVLRGFGGFGVNPFPSPIEVFIAAYEWGRYLGPEALEKGVEVCVSSWNRLAPNTLPTMAKASANYMNSQLIKMEAIKDGYEEGIALDEHGYVSEGSGENIFVIKDGKVMTPPLHASILPGITRDSVLKICKDLGIEIAECNIPREFLYIADEVFLTGTAAEITPIRAVDRIEVGSGARGPVTKAIQEQFFAIISGQSPDSHHWLMPIYDPEHPAPPVPGIGATVTR